MKTYLQETTASRVRSKRMSNKNKDTTNDDKHQSSRSGTILTPIGNEEGAVLKPSIDDIDELHKSGSETSDVENNNNDIIEIKNDDDEDDDYEDKCSSEEDENRAAGLDPFWKKTLRQEERLNGRVQLKKLHERANFLPNPRLFAARTAPL